MQPVLPAGQPAVPAAYVADSAAAAAAAVGVQNGAEHGALGFEARGVAAPVERYKHLVGRLHRRHMAAPRDGCQYTG